jgi:HK97 family phage portal protein
MSIYRPEDYAPVAEATKHSYPSEYYGLPRVPWNMGLGEFFEAGRGTNWNTVSAVWAAVRLLSQDLASLPLFIYRRRDDGGREKAPDHDLYPVLHRRVNPVMSSFQWREVQMSHLLTWGNCFSEKVYDRVGRLQLYPIRPDRMRVRWDATGTKREYFHTGPDSIERKMQDGSVFHVAGLSWDGLVGYSPVTLARRTLGIAARTGSHAESFYAGGAKPGVVLTVPAGYPDVAKENLRDGWNEFRRPEKHGETAVLEDGVTAMAWSMPHDDAQFIETWKFQVSEVARWFLLPPHKLGDLEHATFSNIEQQALEYVIHSLRPWLVRWEQTIALDLLGEDDDHYAEFQMDALLRGDAESRAKALNVQLRSGVVTPDEWRSMENRNPLPDDIGTEPLVSADMLALRSFTESPEPEPPPGPAPPSFEDVEVEAPPTNGNGAGLEVPLG